MKRPFRVDLAVPSVLVLMQFVMAACGVASTKPAPVRVAVVPN